jgi:hypothetical protein
MRSRGLDGRQGTSQRSEAEVTIENSIESYLFTCVRCGRRWAEDYQVSQVTDDGGALRSFYRHHGVPCEAPVSGNVECPDCHATRAARDPLYGAAPDFALGGPGDFPLAVPAQRPAAAGPARHVAPGTWHRFRFSAVVTLEGARRRGGPYLSGVPGLMLHAPSCQAPARHQYFPAVVYTDDNRPLRPGDKGVAVVCSVPDDDAADFFQPGQHFAVWDGADIGHGTVAERLFFPWP